MKSDKNTSKTVKSYLKSLDPNMQNTLAKVRQNILSVVPNAEEVISYHIPTFKLNGTPFAAIAAFKKHCSYFTLSHGVMKELKDDLSKYHTSGVTIHFEPGKPLPKTLIRKLMKAKLKENEQRAAKKKAKK